MPHAIIEPGDGAGGSAPSSNPTGSHSSLGSSRSPSQTLRGDGTQTDVSCEHCNPILGPSLGMSLDRGL